MNSRRQHIRHIAALCGSILSNATILMLIAQAFSGLFGQTPGNHATLRGRLTDQTGGAVVGVAVRLSKAGETGEFRAARTDSFGDYAFASVPSGAYQLHVELGGFAPLERDVSLSAGTVVVQDLVMKVSAQATQVVVRADAAATLARS